VQRLTNNNRPQFTDAEVLTVYVWGLRERLLTVKSIHRFTNQYLLDCFPKLPSYAAFSRRLNELSPALEGLMETLVITEENLHADVINLLDSIPIIVSRTKRREPPHSAEGFCSVGYCSTKKLHYYGVKLSVLGVSRAGTLPFPRMIGICPANEADITMGKEMLADLYNTLVAGDRGFHSLPWQEELASRGVILLTPPKRQRNSPPLSQEELAEFHRLARIRQPIEAFSSFLQSRYRIEDASFVRSVKGLLSFIWGRLVAALFRLKGCFDS